MAKYLNIDLIFKDRTDAGKELANKLFGYKLVSPIVIALPRGGVSVAKPIADILHAKLDIMVSKKIGAPGNPELAIGAVTSHGDYVISAYVGSIHELILPGQNKWDYLQEQMVYLIKDSSEREARYKEGLTINGKDNQEISYKDQNIILVDDGTATGMTALAAIKSIKKQNPLQIILAIPVISSEAYDEIKPQVNKIETLKIPREFIAVGVHYKDFNAVTDEEIKGLLI